MDFHPDGVGGAGGGDTLPQGLQKPEHGQRRQWLVEVWSYTVFMAVALNLIVVLLAGDLLLVIPVAFVCLLAGAVGTILAIHRSRRLTLNEHTQFESIFR
jgi:hypothetical protein